MPLLRRGWEAYIRLLQRRPYVGNSATGAIVMLSGDALAQWHEQRGASASKRYDGKRAAVMVVFSVVIFMPTNTFWLKNVAERGLPDVVCAGSSYVSCQCLASRHAAAILVLTRRPALRRVVCTYGTR
eukprot:COSAG06_NODE_7377_length_2523_cov_1.815182_5_plen_128_part_00